MAQLTWKEYEMIEARNKGNRQSIKETGGRGDHTETDDIAKLLRHIRECHNLLGNADVRIPLAGSLDDED